jgi:SAM-dependent methyltransferase
MSVEAVQQLSHKKLGDDDVQNCPLCGQSHPISFKGIGVMSDGKAEITTSKGFSFCNCSNIFFTDWSNIEPAVYNDEYYKKYQEFSTKGYLDGVVGYAKRYYPVFEENRACIRNFLEVGAINDILLDEAKKKGWEVVGNDIFEHETKHKQIVGDFENVKIDEKFDVIWASHVFEHFKEPLKVIDKCRDTLSGGGLLFIAMPDPWFINHAIIHNSPTTWCHLHIREHHIMWDMDSFIDKVLERGFELILSKRNAGIDFLTHGDFHLVFKKV